MFITYVFSHVRTFLWFLLTFLLLSRFLGLGIHVCHVTLLTVSTPPRLATFPSPATPLRGEWVAAFTSTTVCALEENKFPCSAERQIKDYGKTGKTIGNVKCQTFLSEFGRIPIGGAGTESYLTVFRVKFTVQLLLLLIQITARDRSVNMRSCHASVQSYSLQRRANARNVTLPISLRWPIHIINHLIKPKYLVLLYGRLSWGKSERFLVRISPCEPFPWKLS